jgi:threonine dehydrogenase-like Zn-dependent dehydrogenase
LDVINPHERDLSAYAAGIYGAVDAVAKRQLDPSPLFTHRFPLEDLGAALDATRDRPEGFMKALIVYE